MDIPFLCVFICFLLIYLPKFLSVIAIKIQFRDIDLKYPRDQQLQLSGWGKRAYAAHLNALENFPIFAIAVIIAHIQSVDQLMLAKLSIGYIALRLIYYIFYLVDLSILRTTAWAFQIAIIIYMFIMSL